MARHDPESEEGIRALIAAWLQAKGYTTLQIDDCVLGVRTLINGYGQLLNILNARGAIRDSQGLAELIGHYVDIRAIACNDPDARRQVQTQSHAVVRHVCHGARITLDSQACGHVAAAAAQRVCEIAAGGVEDTEWPMRLQDVINEAVDAALRQHLEAQGGPIPERIAQQTEGQQPEYQALTGYEAQRLVVTGASHLLEDYCACIKQAFIQLTPAQQRLLALAYYYDGQRVPTLEVAQALRALNPQKQFPVPAVEANLSGARSALRQKVQEQFVERITHLLDQGAEGPQRIATILQRLCRMFLRDCNLDLALREAFLTQLHTLADDPSSRQAVVSTFCSHALPATGLAPEDRNFIENIVCLVLAVNNQDYNGMATHCEKICDQGIPDLRERLFSPGIRAMGSTLCVSMVVGGDIRVGNGEGL